MALNQQAAAVRAREAGRGAPAGGGRARWVLLEQIAGARSTEPKTVWYAAALAKRIRIAPVAAAEDPMRLVLWVIAIFALSAAPLRAQSESDHPLAIKHRNNCRLAVQALITGEPHTKRDWARTYVRGCPEEGPPALVHEWRTVAGDTATVVQLIRSSVEIRDARIYEQLRAVVRDRSRSDVVRVGAMHVLHRYLEPTSGGWFWGVRPPADSTRTVRAGRGSVSHSVSVDGPVPLGSVREPLLELLDEIASAQAAEPRTVWYAAAAIAKRIRLRPS